MQHRRDRSFSKIDAALYHAFFENAVSTLKSKACHQVLCLTATSHCCRPCQRISLRELPVPIPHSNIDSIADTSALQTILREIIPHCPNSFHELIVSQHDAHAAKSNRGVRWSMYKNTVQQAPGLQEEVFKWMHDEAQRLALSNADRQGGIVIDEMAIQPDLQMVRDNDGFKLVGFTVLDPEMEAAGIMRRNGENTKELATHVLQLLFLGFGGFRFPIAHFPCTQATATDLHVILWSAVEMLSAYGFPVLYVNMDGAITNRQMHHIQFPISSPSHQSFLAANPIPNQNKIAFIMDYSHVIKKIRNSLLNSTANGTRLIEDSAGNEIIWDFWVEAFKHSDSTPLHLHRKLTRPTYISGVC